MQGNSDDYLKEKDDELPMIPVEREAEEEEKQSSKDLNVEGIEVGHLAEDLPISHKAQKGNNSDNTSI